MTDLRNFAIGAVFRAFEFSQAHRILRPFTGGIGAILMMHRVSSDPDASFVPNISSAIMPPFLLTVIETLRDNGFVIVSLESALTLMDEGGGPERFAVLTFDDGFQDIHDNALPAFVNIRRPSRFTLRRDLSIGPPGPGPFDSNV